MSIDDITSFGDCVSDDERRQRFGITLANLVLWSFLLLVTVGMTVALIASPALVADEAGGLVVPFVAFLGFLFVKFGLGYLLSEYNVRMLQAQGATVSEEQFPAVYRAAREVRARFGLKREVPIIVISSGEANAFAIQFARKRVVVILSELLEAVIQHPGELRAILGHEMCHTVLDHGLRGVFEVYKTARYRAAREMTCDNAGYVAAGDYESARMLLRKLCAGKRLHTELSDASLAREARRIYSGFIGWLLAQKLNYPPFGRRLQNVDAFARKYPAPPSRHRQPSHEAAAVHA